jgi:predicted MFS family arabinose efflux permease
LIAFSFLQLFSTLPLFYRDVHFLSEAKIGYLMALNGLIIFFTEMPLIKHLEKPKFSIYRLLIVSILLLAASFLVLNLSPLTIIVTISVLLLTVGEMINFPFLNRFALNRAENGRSGDYMALFTIAFSFGHIIGPYLGMKMVDLYGYGVAWYVMTGVLVLASLLVIVLKKAVQKEN